MPLYENIFEGGTNGVTITTTNSGEGTSGYPFSAIQNGVGGTVKYSNTAAAHGSMGMLIEVTDPLVSAYVQAGFPGSDYAGTRFYYKMPVVSNVGGNYIFTYRSSVATVCSIGLNASGNLAMYNSAGAIIAGSSAPSALSPNTWVRINVWANPFTGNAIWGYYLGESTTPVFQSELLTAQSLGSAQIIRARFGKTQSSNFAGNFLYDSTSIDTDLSAPGAPGPYVSSSVNAGVDKVGVEPWSTVTLTATGSSTATWSHVSGPNPALSGSGSTRTFIAPASFVAATSVFRATVGGAFDEVSVTYLPATDGLVTSVGPVVITPIRLTRVP